MRISQELKVAKIALEELKGIDILELDVTQHTAFFSHIIICTGSSGRHTRSLADHVARMAKEQGLNVLGYASDLSSDWVLVDLGDVVVHVMQAETREFYSLENLWGPFEEQYAEAIAS